jgi:aspartate/methionine/tyrosine aminotransferase
MPIEIEAPEEMGADIVKYNLTESSYTDQKFKDLGIDLSKVTFFYGPHRGPDELRELIAKNGKCAKEDVLVTSGASAALFLIATSLVGEGDHVIVQHPNYGSNIETPRLLGCDVELMTCYQENNYQVTLEDIKKTCEAQYKVNQYCESS